MSEPIPEAIPTSSRPSRPTKRLRPNPRTPLTTSVEALFAHPEKQIAIPPSTSTSPTTSSNTHQPPEIVANVQGSSAGAGSGEFHVYKASRRREYERLRAMDEEVLREGEEKAFLERKAEVERRDRERTERNRAKRAKALARKGKKGGEGVKEGVKRKLAPSAGVRGAGDGEGKEDGEEDGHEHKAEGELKTVEETGLVIEDDE